MGTGYSYVYTKARYTYPHLWFPSLLVFFFLIWLYVNIPDGDFCSTSDNYGQKKKKKKSLMATLGSIPENYNIQEGRIAIAIIISNEPSAATTTVSYDDRW